MVPASSTAALAALKRLGARVIGVLSDAVTQGRKDLLRAAVATGAVVLPAAFGRGSARPASCAAGQCCTGAYGAGVPPDAGGRCPLVFSIASDGVGLGKAVETAIAALAGEATVRLDVGARVEDDPRDRVNAVRAFVRSLSARTTASSSPRCTGGLKVGDRDPFGDGVDDTFIGVKAGTPVCFDLVLRTNRTVRALTWGPLLFRATLTIYAGRTSPLEKHVVWFYVPARS